MAYIGYSMSERARDAYLNDETPLSSWRKRDIISKIGENISIAAAEYCKKFSLAFLKQTFLKKTSWHHTGKLYRKTDFYSFKCRMKEGEILQLQENKKEKPAEREFFPASAVWIDFKKSGRRWKTTEIFRFGRCDGKIFISLDDTKKLCSGKTFTFKNLTEKENKKLLERMKEEFKKCFNVPTCHKLNKWIKTGSIYS